jgi:hypothetical protein
MNGWMEDPIGKVTNNSSWRKGASMKLHASVAFCQALSSPFPTPGTRYQDYQKLSTAST